MADIAHLERLEREETVLSFLEQHMGMDDEDVVECMVELAVECDTFDNFKEEINGALGLELDGAFEAMFQAVRETVLNSNRFIKGGVRSSAGSSTTNKDVISAGNSGETPADSSAYPTITKRERSRSRSPVGDKSARPARQPSPIRAVPRPKRQLSPIRATVAPTKGNGDGAGGVGSKWFDNTSSLVEVKDGDEGGVHNGQVKHDIVEQVTGLKRGAITGVPLEDQHEYKTRLYANNGNDYGGMDENRNRRKAAAMTDLERWEMDRLRATGNRDRLLDADDKGAAFSTAGGGGAAEDVDIVVTDSVPVFMRGVQKKHRDLQPVQVVAVPDGSLSRAAEKQGELARERRLIQEEQDQAIRDAVPKDINRPWEDPAAKPGERLLASTLQAITKGMGGGSNKFDPVRNLARTAGAGGGSGGGGVNQGGMVSLGPRTNKSMREQRESLPIFPLRGAFLEAVAKNQALVVVGETGSGKTTQMTQYLMEAGFGRPGNGIIACTQPRRVAAQSIAKRVAEEVGCTLGSTVGYSFRYEDCTSRETVIKYMTDGMLLREATNDPAMSRYSVIILDEAHERTLSTDVLFGLLKQSLRLRQDLKVIVTSATLNEEKFASYFFNCPIFKFPGRTFPVLTQFAKEPVSDYLEAAMMMVLEIHLKEPPGDILVFLTGRDEIDTACETLASRMERLKDANPPPLLLYPAYSSLPSEVQTAIFDPTPKGSRKCVIATNIAEASLTIDGIYYVVDPGFAKVKMYNPKKGMESLVVVPIAQANARQRAGRAGRTGPGKCYRLYTEHAFKYEMLPSAIPELLRTNLATVVLSLKAMGVIDLFAFEFMDPPPQEALANAMLALFELGALDEEGLLTPSLGRRMAEFPLDPPLSKTLLAAVDLGCVNEVLTIVAMLQASGSGGSVFYRPRDKQAQADQKKAKFHQPEGDHLTLLEVYKGWEGSGWSTSWCFDNFIQHRAMREAKEARLQLVGIMQKLKLAGGGNNSNSLHETCTPGVSANEHTIRKALCAGYFRHACVRDKQGEGYRTLLDNEQVYIHPSSAVYRQQPEYIIYHELVMTTKEYVREVTAIDPNWLPLLAPNLYKKGEGLTAAKKAQKIQPLHNRFQEKDAWRLSKRQW